MQTFAQAKTRDTVAAKLGIGSGKQYEKEKFISDNRSFLTIEQSQIYDSSKDNKSHDKIPKYLQIL